LVITKILTNLFREKEESLGGIMKNKSIFILYIVFTANISHIYCKFDFSLKVDGFEIDETHMPILKGHCINNRYKTELSLFNIIKTINNYEYLNNDFSIVKNYFYKKNITKLLDKILFYKNEYIQLKQMKFKLHFSKNIEYDLYFDRFFKKTFTNQRIPIYNSCSYFLSIQGTTGQNCKISDNIYLSRCSLDETINYFANKEKIKIIDKELADINNLFKNKISMKNTYVNKFLTKLKKKIKIPLNSVGDIIDNYYYDINFIDITEQEENYLNGVIDRLKLLFEYDMNTEKIYENQNDEVLYTEKHGIFYNKFKKQIQNILKKSISFHKNCLKNMKTKTLKLLTELGYVTLYPGYYNERLRKVQYHRSDIKNLSINILTEEELPQCDFEGGMPDYGPFRHVKLYWDGYPKPFRFYQH